MEWERYQYMLLKAKYDNATTGGGDNSTDPLPAKDPNDYLASMTGATAGHVAIIILVYLLIAYVGILIYKKVKS